MFTFSHVCTFQSDYRNFTDLFNDSDTDVEDTNIGDEESIESDGVPTEEGKFLL